MDDATTTGTPATAVVLQQPTTKPAANTTTTVVTPQSSLVLQNITSPTDGAERPSQLFEGAWEFSKAGYPPFPFGHLAVYTCGDETLTILSNKPQIVSHREAAEQIVRALGARPEKLLYLYRTCVGPEGSGAGFCRDLIVQYAFAWEWTHSRWIATQQTYCYRVLPATEKAITRLMSLSQQSTETNVVEVPNAS